MKKITLLLAIALSTAAFSQNVISLRGNLAKQFETGSITLFGPGASFQHALNENMAFGLNFDYLVGESSYSMMNIEPRFDYYLNSMFDGLHVGSNIGFNNSNSFKALQLGALIGYTHPLNDNLHIDISTGAGLGMILETGGGSNFGIRPTLSIGYKL